MRRSFYDLSRKTCDVISSASNPISFSKVIGFFVAWLNLGLITETCFEQAKPACSFPRSTAVIDGHDRSMRVPGYSRGWVDCLKNQQRLYVGKGRLIPVQAVLWRTASR